jgi:3-oxoacyl-[acyl-carrier protein] reductase
MDGRVAIVTGPAFGRAGANVVVADLNEEGITETVRQIGEKARAVRADVSSSAGVEELVATAVSEFGRLDPASSCA